MKKLVFVYGTLKKNHGNNSVLSDSPLVGEAITTDKFFMTNVGFPYMIPSEEAAGYPALPVLGEVYEVTDPKVMSSLDYLEGVAYNHYRHHEVSVKLNDTGEVVEALAYVPFDGEEACGIKNVCNTSEYQNQTVYQF